jgi:CDP-glucose 4,6-dehydratase
VPDLLAAFTQGKDANVRNPHAVRPWQHVLDPLNAYLILAEHLYVRGAEFAEAWNFGPEINDCRTVSWVADRLAEKWGNGATWSSSSTFPYHEANFLKLDCSKAKSRLGWTPRWNLFQALDAVVEWHKCFKSGNDVRQISIEQLRRFNQTEFKHTT